MAHMPPLLLHNSSTLPLLLLIRDMLGLTTTDIGNAEIASVSSVVFMRVAMGTACDLVGP